MQPTEDERRARAIDRFENEPLEFIGAIQSFGCLVATDRRFQRIRRVSTNFQRFMGAPPDDALGAEPERFFSAEFCHSVRNLLGYATIEAQRASLATTDINGRAFTAAAHIASDHAIVELMPIGGAGSDPSDVLHQVQSFLDLILKSEDPTSVLEAAVRRFSELSRVDRVVAFRFMPDGAREVVAEARTSDVPSFFGLRFPALDLSTRTRDAYKRSPIRVIEDLDAPSAAIIAEEPGAPPLDLSLSLLRSAPSDHLEYLRNMGVRSDMKLPLVVDDRLWGLIAFQHSRPNAVDPLRLSLFDVLCRYLTSNLENAFRRTHEERLRECINIASRLIAVDDSELSTSEYWARTRRLLFNAVKCDGVAYCIDRSAIDYGLALTAPARNALRAYAAAMDEDVVCINNLSVALPDVDFADVGGAMVLKLRQAPQIMLLYLRRKTDHVVHWAGPPEHDVIDGPNGPMLAPRRSFAPHAAPEIGGGESWSSDDYDTARSLRLSLQQAIETQSELKEHRHRLGLLVRELNHRVRNILSLVHAIARQTRSAAVSVDGYVTALEARIVSLANAHNLMTREGPTGVNLRELAELEMQPYGALGGERVALAGPSVRSTADATPVLALLIHELVSNAVKYGALSGERGQAALTWSLERGGLAMEWRETGGPRVAPPENEGFGRAVIEGLIPYEFDGEAQLDFTPEGVQARFWLPSSCFDMQEEHDASAPIRPLAFGGPAVAPLGKSKACLIVEDNFVVASELKRMLRRIGFEEVGAASSVRVALQSLAARPYAFCVLDVNLAGEMSEPVAAELRRLGTPFVFATGYGSAGREITGSYNAPVLTKPIMERDLLDAISTLE